MLLNANTLQQTLAAALAETSSYGSFRALRTRTVYFALVCLCFGSAPFGAHSVKTSSVLVAARVVRIVRIAWVARTVRVVWIT